MLNTKNTKKLILSEFHKCNKKTFLRTVLILTFLITSLLFVPAKTFAQGMGTEQTIYGTGDSEKYYKWTETDGDMKLEEVLNISDAQIIVKYGIGDYIDKTKVIYDGYAKGAALNNPSGMDTGIIEGIFAGNNLYSAIEYSASMAGSYGGAVYNEGSIAGIRGDFINNYAVSTRNVQGGAIDNEGSIAFIEGNFIGNYASSLHSNVAIGGAIYNSGEIDRIKGVFIGNHVISPDMTYYSQVYGGALNNAFDSSINTITADFIGNYAYGEKAQGGAINNEGVLGAIINSSFINNYAKAEGDYAKASGGAIFSTKPLNIIAQNEGISLISGNYTLTNGIKNDEAIYVSVNETAEYDVNTGRYYCSVSTGELTLNANTKGTIIIDDKITGDQGGGKYYEEWNSETGERDKIYVIPDGENYKIHITGDETGLVQINNKVDAVTGEADIDLSNTTLHLAKDDTVFNGNNLTLNSGALSMLNNQAGTMALKDFTLNGNTNFASDVNLANKTMDRITADTYTVNTAATLNVNYLNLLNDAESYETRILFADADLANNVAYTGLSPIAYSPIYKYQIDYLKETGEFLFTRGAGGSSSNPSDNFNPSVLPTPVNNQAGGYTTQLQTFNYAFQHSDTFMQIPAAQRFAIKSQNKYALSPTGDATDVGVFSPLLTKYETGGIWFKPYASFENIPLKNGPKVNNINYGTLVGFDSNLKSIKYGWERVLTGYIGYNGATQNFSGVTSNQNGGILGTTATFYKGNFFNATTLSVGATAGSNNTMYGSEDYTMLLAGIADKFGYNFEFKEGKYIIQPSMLMSYSFVNTFDYRNAAGVNIQSDPLNALQLAPGIKFIMNTKNGWQPYIGVNMVWNIMDQTKVKANDVRLPSMSIDPYVEYGVGVQRKWGERFMGYAQAMVHNGGRNGISLNGGFRWAIGKK